jgi:N-acetylglucosaminyl-diphospho-decaprenol L-rhamnosyltransferase
MSIGFVVVTFNSAAVLGDCLSAIPAGREIVVVDNCSQDQSVAVAKSFAVQILANPKNLGFGAACNLGARRLSAPYVFFLNPDAVLEKDALFELEQAIEKFPDAGGFAPAVKICGESRSFRNKSYIQDQGRRYMPDSQAPAGYADVDFIDGAALVCNRDLFLTLGGFDENLFLYYEDDDLSYRIRSHNKRLVYVPFSAVTHKKKGSSGPAFKLNYMRSWHETRSRMILSKKYKLPFDLAKEKKRAHIRLLRSALTLRLTKTARYLAVAQALRADVA